MGGRPELWGMPPIKPIQAPGTIRPAGHYSQAVVANGFVFVAGQLPSDLTTGKPVPGPIEAQAEQALANVGRVLAAAGSGLEHAVQMTIYLSNLDHWGAVNAVYARVMGDHRPARAIVPVGPLHYDTGIEIQCIAVVPKRAPKARKPAPRRAGRRAR